MSISEESKSVQSNRKRPSTKLEKDENLIFETSENIVVYDRFEDMGLHEHLIKGLYSYGFEKPSAV
jgi:superfamily II DNA/RNA helicase